MNTGLEWGCRLGLGVWAHTWGGERTRVRFGLTLRLKAQIRWLAQGGSKRRLRSPACLMLMVQQKRKGTRSRRQRPYHVGLSRRRRWTETANAPQTNFALNSLIHNRRRPPPLNHREMLKHNPAMTAANPPANLRFCFLSLLLRFVFSWFAQSFPICGIGVVQPGIEADEWHLDENRYAPLLFCCESLLSRWPRCSALQVVAWFAGLWFSHRKHRRWCLVIPEINANGERWSYGFSMVESLVNRCRLLKIWWRLVMPLAITKSFLLSSFSLLFLSFCYSSVEERNEFPYGGSAMADWKRMKVVEGWRFVTVEGGWRIGWRRFQIKIAKCFKIPSDCEFSFPSLFVFLAVMEYGEGEGSVKVHKVWRIEVEEDFWLWVWSLLELLLDCQFSVCKICCAVSVL